jgi:cyclin-dependent kinase 7
MRNAKKLKVAIKKVKLGEFKEGLDMSAIREIKYLNELKHPNVIEVHHPFTQLIDVFSLNQNLHLVLEFLESDMEMIIKDKTVVFGAADIKSWMLMILRGLNHCHQSFILHRVSINVNQDLKPNNLLLSSDGELKIADFGLARLYGDPRTAMSHQVVTRWYRSPELLLGTTFYSTGIDIWSVGCIFAELMLRTPYFAAETDIGQLDTIFRALGNPTEDDWPVFIFIR